MDEWKEVKNWEACKAKGEGKEVMVFWSDQRCVMLDHDWDFRPAWRFKVKVIPPDPARLLGKKIWTKDGNSRMILFKYQDKKYFVENIMGPEGWYTASEIEKEFDVKD